MKETEIMAKKKLSEGPEERAKRRKKGSHGNDRLQISKTSTKSDKMQKCRPECNIDG